MYNVFFSERQFSHSHDYILAITSTAADETITITLRTQQWWNSHAEQMGW